MYKLLKEFNLEIGVEQILKGQGIDPARASARLWDISKEVVSELDSLLEPAALSVTLPVIKCDHGRVNFEGGSFEGPLVTRTLAGAARLSLTLCTIGPRLEEKVSELMNTEPVKALALDGAGTAAISWLSSAVIDLLNAEAEQNGLKTGMKGEPGQEGWPIEQQRVIFGLLPAEQIQVRLTDSCLMLPRKSLTFVIGQGKEMSKDKISCDLCSMRDRCHWRTRAAE